MIDLATTVRNEGRGREGGAEGAWSGDGKREGGKDEAGGGSLEEGGGGRMRPAMARGGSLEELGGRRMETGRRILHPRLTRNLVYSS